MSDLGVPVAEDERVALDRPRADRLVALVEEAPPELVAVEEEALRLGLLARLELGTGVGEAVHVVVAGEEEARHRAAVRTPVARKHLEPGSRDGLELRQFVPGGKVAGDEHGVHLAFVKVAQSLLEPVSVRKGRDVDIRKYADPQIGLGRGLGKSRSGRAERRRRLDEISSSDCHGLTVLGFESLKV